MWVQMSVFFVSQPSYYPIIFQHSHSAWFFFVIFVDNQSDSSARNSRGGYHGDAQHKDKSGKQGEVERYSLHHHQCQCAGYDFQCAARQMDGGAERNHETCHFGRYPVLSALFRALRGWWLPKTVCPMP